MANTNATYKLILIQGVRYELNVSLHFHSNVSRLFLKIYNKKKLYRLSFIFPVFVYSQSVVRKPPRTAIHVTTRHVFNLIRIIKKYIKLAKKVYFPHVVWGSKWFENRWSCMFKKIIVFVLMVHFLCMFPVGRHSLADFRYTKFDSFIFENNWANCQKLSINQTY